MTTAAGHSRYRAVVAYDGAPFRGFAPNPGVATVGGALADALSTVLGQAVELTCAGRTDAGVHAWGQVVSFDGPDDVDPGRLQHRLNRMLAPDIVVRALERVASDFDARFSATGRTYRYQVLDRALPDPFLHRTTWHVDEPLDLGVMNAAAADLVGSHDFTSFCRKRTLHVAGETILADLTREVRSAEWGRAGELAELWISANAFCHQMVRAVVGTLVEIGLGRRPVDSIPAAIAARDRAAAGALAPPHGLTLWEVEYPASHTV